VATAKELGLKAGDIIPYVATSYKKDSVTGAIGIGIPLSNPDATIILKVGQIIKVSYLTTRLEVLWTNSDLKNNPGDGPGVGVEATVWSEFKGFVDPKDPVMVDEIKKSKLGMEFEFTPDRSSVTLTRGEYSEIIPNPRAHVATPQS